ncbi:MAG TPA: nucleotidyltransferase family protein [Candidatus Sulfotelmatobacter sp.]|jgi:NDP-sugar pyrophosphorylase family protein
MLPVAILAGGLATRLGPLTEKNPKSLIPIAGEPFIAHQLRLLKRNRIQDVILCVGYLGEMIESVLGDGHAFGMKIEYSYDGDKLLGTAGAIRQALPKLGDSFFVLYGDSYLPCDYAAIEQEFSRSGKPGLMTVFRNQGQWDTSNVEFEGGQILAYSKQDRTPRMRYIDYGLGLFNRTVFDETGLSDLAEVYSGLLRENQLSAFEVRQRFYEIGSIAGIQELESLLASPGEEKL